MALSASHRFAKVISWGSTAMVLPVWCQYGVLQASEPQIIHTCVENDRVVTQELMYLFSVTLSQSHNTLTVQFFQVSR